MRVASLFARDGTNIVNLQITPADGGATHPARGTVTLTATSADLGDNVSEMDASIEGDEVEVAFNARYMIDALSVVGTPEVALETSTSSSPGVLKPVGGDDFLCVIMPMHITR